MTSFWELEVFRNFSYFENLRASTLDVAAEKSRKENQGGKDKWQQHSTPNQTGRREAVPMRMSPKSYK